MARKLILFACALALLIAGFGVYRFIYPDNRLTLEEARALLGPELKAGPTVVSSDENAIGLVREAIRIAGKSNSWHDAMAPLKGKTRSDEPDWPALRREFKKRVEVVALSRRIVRAGKIAFDSRDMFRESLRVFDMAYVLMAGFRLAFRDGRNDEAFDLAMLKIGLAKAAYSGGQSKLVFLNAYFPEKMGLEELTALVNCRDVPAPILRRLLEHLPEEGVEDSTYAKILVGGFYNGFLDDLVHPNKSRKEMELAGPLDAIQTLRVANEIATAEIHNAHVPWSRANDIDALKSRLTATAPEKPFFMNYGPAAYSRTKQDDAEVALYKTKCLLVPNAAGFQLIRSTLGGAGDELAVRRRAQINCLRVLAAIRICLIQTHRLPSGLSELVDLKILKSIPVDPYTGDPVRFNAKTSTVYTMGENLIDDGGAIEMVKTGSSYETPDIGARLKIRADCNKIRF